MLTFDITRKRKDLPENKSMLQFNS